MTHESMTDDIVMIHEMTTQELEINEPSMTQNLMAHKQPTYDNDMTLELVSVKSKLALMKSDLTSIKLELATVMLKLKSITSVLHLFYKVCICHVFCITPLFA